MRKTLKSTSTYFYISVCFLIVAIGLIGFTHWSHNRLIETMSIQSASLYSNALAEFRTIYTSEVVNRLKNDSKISFKHDYQKQPNSLPLPATLSMHLGEKIGSNNSGANSSLYSPYPFPWRQVEGGISSDFRRNAWQSLNEGQQSYFKFTEIEGRRVIRYATADVMREACIDCHNSHPDSPKVDWKVGDIRGVLEVIQPIEKITRQAQDNLLTFYLLIAIILSISLGSLIFFISLQRRNRNQLTSKLNATKSAVELSEKALAKSEKLAALGLVSVGIAHEINQPLAAAKLTLSLVEKKIYGLGLGLDSKLERLNRQINRVSEIVVQLNEASVNENPLENEVADLDLAIENSVDWLTSQLEDKNIQFTYKTSSATKFVQANRLELERVLLNLITNSIHALQENENAKEIRLNCYIEGETAVVEIYDNGCGIEEKNRSKIFDPFFTTKPVGEGMGMGLAMCYAIITKYHGNIEYSVPQDSRGSLFKISIPRLMKKTEA